MLHGFEEEGFSRGVPMIAKPKSEAWLLCALKGYQGCAALETRSGNDSSPNSLKAELRDRLKGDASAEKLRDLVRDRSIEFQRIDMPSFLAFRQRLEEVIAQTPAGPSPTSKARR